MPDVLLAVPAHPAAVGPVDRHLPHGPVDKDLEGAGGEGGDEQVVGEEVLEVLLVVVDVLVQGVTPDESEVESEVISIISNVSLMWPIELNVCLIVH